MGGSAIGDSNDARTCLEGLRVLVIEDDYLVAMLLVDSLEELGCEVVGPCATVARALEVANSEQFDVALLDFHLSGEDASPVAERLSALDRPFAIASGGGIEIEGHGQITCLAKPFRVSDVATALRALIARTDDPSN